MIKIFRLTIDLLQKQRYNIKAKSFGGVAQLGERTVRIRKVESSILFVSTKQVLDEHLFLQRRFRR